MNYISYKVVVFKLLLNILYIVYRG